MEYKWEINAGSDKFNPDAQDRSYVNACPVQLH